MPIDAVNRKPIFFKLCRGSFWLLCLFVFLRANSATAQNLVQNGGFETGEYAPWVMSGVTDENTILTGTYWAHSGTYGAGIGPGGALGFIAQTLATSPGQWYLISLWIHPPAPYPHNVVDFRINWDGNTLLDLPNPSVTTWTNVQITVQATAASSVFQLGFRDDDSSFALDDVSVTAIAPPVAVFGAPEIASWNDDVVSKISGAGQFGKVDEFFIGPGKTAPTLAQLQQYAAILVYCDTEGFGDATNLGNALADYSDWGGGVVLGALDFGNDFNKGNYLQGRFATNGSMPFTVYTGYAYYTEYTMALPPDDPSHPILDGVSSFDGGDFSMHDNFITTTNSFVLVAHWTDGQPLIAAAKPKNARVAGLNFYPPSADAEDGNWVTTTDGALIMANSLLWTERTLAPAVTWTNPGPVYAGTALGSNQLDATANVSGTFVYTPPAGTVPPMGTNQLSVVFTPADTDDAPLTNSVFLIVLPPPTEEDLHGHFLSISTNVSLYTNYYFFTNEVTICNPTLSDSRPGYIELDEFLDGGGEISLGSFPFTSVPAGGCVTLDVGGEGQQIGDGNGFTTNVYGTVYEQAALDGNPPQGEDSQLVFQFFSIAPPNGGVPVGGSGLSAPGFGAPPELTNLTITGPLSIPAGASTNYLATAGFGDGSTDTNVAPTWSSSLFSISNGVFQAGTVSTDTVVVISNRLTIRSVTRTASLSVLVAAPHIPPVVTWTNPAAVFVGAALGSNQLNASANVPGVFVYTPPAGTVLPVGSNQLTAIFTPTDTVEAPVTNRVTLLVFPPPSLEDLHGHFLFISANTGVYTNGLVFTNNLTLCNPTLLESRPGFVALDEFFNGGGASNLGVFAFPPIPAGGCLEVEVGGAAASIGAAAGQTTNIFGTVYEQSVLPGNPPLGQDSRLILQFFSIAPPKGGVPPNGATNPAPGFVAPPALTNLAVTGPALIQANASGVFLATASFDDGSSETNVAVAWSSSLFGVSNGVFTAGNVLTDTSVTVSGELTIRSRTETGAAAATVVASRPAQLQALGASPNSFQLQLTGTTGNRYVLEAATNLGLGAAWSAVATNQILSNSILLLSDPGAATNGQRFYRTKAAP